MQWRSDGSLAPEPVVALLGPRGSGKSTALHALSRKCGGTIVHARLDFAEHPDLDPISGVASVAFSLMRGWTNLRRRPVFHRLGLSLLALNEQLDSDRAVAQVQIKRLIRQYVQRQPLVRAGEQVPAERFPGATQTLRELRTNLWVSTFAARPSPLWPVGHGTEEHPAALHPWISRCLLAGLAEESTDAGASMWEDLFGTVFDNEPDPGHTLFRDLAQGRFGAVVEELAALFDTVDHRTWVRVLDDATSAPCRLPHSEPFVASYRRLAPDHVPGRTAIEAAVTSLTALLWLYRDPLTVPDALHGTASKVQWHKQIRIDFGKLAHVSARTDVSALEEAASQFEYLT